MAVGDLYKAVVKGEVFGVDCENAFWFRQESFPDPTYHGARTLGQAIRIKFVEPLVELMSNDADFDLIEVQNYTNPSEAWIETIVSGVGEVDSEAAPSQWAVGMKFSRPYAGWNYPRKRLFGFPLFVFSGNDIDSGVAGALAGIAANWGGMSTGGNVFRWKILRTGTGFGLGSEVITAEENVGTLLDVYDAVQQSRRN